LVATPVEGDPNFLGVREYKGYQVRILISPAAQLYEDCVRLPYYGPRLCGSGICPKGYNLIHPSLHGGAIRYAIAPYELETALNHGWASQRKYPKRPHAK
jgi:hypothetical protein